MTRRTDRVASLLRQTIGEIVLGKISDPRIDPARVSITRVEVSEDTAKAQVYFSVMGTESEQRNAHRALQHAAGRIQDLMMRQITLRNTPVLSFLPDEKYKNTLKTLSLIQGAMEELRQSEDLEQQGTEDLPGPEAGE